jgi:membrane protease YdiL (CAAX protease family)
VALYVIAEFAAWVAVSPFAADFDAQPISFIMEKSSVSMAMVVPMAMVNGMYEEVFLLAFLARGLRRYGTSIALGVSLLVRVLYHLYQGPVGAVSVLAFGGVLSVFYLRTGRLFPVVFAHILADIVPFV